MQILASKPWNPPFEKPAFSLNSILHPCHTDKANEWKKWRLTMKGGRCFIDEYLQKFSIREDTNDFNTRSKCTYLPAHAKNAVLDVKNSIHQRMADVTRKEGPATYRDAISGKGFGVDFAGSSMNRYMGEEVLPELLTMGRVGIYIDKPNLQPDASLADTRNVSPYLYLYRVEDIRSWAINRNKEFTSLLLRDTDLVVHGETGLIEGTTNKLRLLQLREDGSGVDLTFFDKDGKKTSDPVTLNLTRIPFCMPEISESLLTDIADYQVALLNMASSDVNYALKSNFPFYVEQYAPQMDMLSNVKGGAQDGTAGEAKKSATNEAKTGSAQGRRYPRGMDQPAFINPSPEPLEVSMKKQDQLKTEIRELMDLALSRVTSSSAESKAHDDLGMEAGLSAIGLELEHAENHISKVWADYEKEDTATVKYPKNWSLKTEEQRRKEADGLKDVMFSVPSLTYQKEMSKKIARVTLGNNLTEEEIEIIDKEIDKAVVIVTDPEVIRSDHESGFVSTETASKSRLYPEGEVEMAKEDHAERIARIAAAQSAEKPGARGVDDASANPDDGKDEKTNSQNPDDDGDGKKKVRGDA